MAQSISDLIGVSVWPERLQLVPGDRATVTLTVTNRGTVVDQFWLRVEGIDPTWFTVRTAEVNLLPDSTGTLDLEIHLPEGRSVPAGVHSVRLAAVSRDHPGSITAVEVPLEVLAVGGVQMELRPLLVTTRGTGHFRVRLSNPSNAARVADLAATDAEEALELRLALDRVDLAPGAAEEVPLTARPRQRPLVAPPRSFRFTVLTLPATDGIEATEALARVEGTLVYQSRLAFLAGLPLRARGPLLALAGLLVAAAIAIWLLSRAGVQFPWNQPSPNPTPAPIAESVAPAAPAATVALTAAPTVAPTPAPRPTATLAPPPKPVAPTINRFEVIVSPDGGRGDFALSWDVEGADEVKIAGKPKPTSGTEQIKDLNDTEFELEATNAGGTVKKSIGIVVLRPPEILALSASATLIDRGDPVFLSWKAMRAERADLAGQEVDPSEGTAEVRPDQSTIYTLVAENELGRVRKSVQVNVRGSAPPAPEEPAGTSNQEV